MEETDYRYEIQYIHLEVFNLTSLNVTEVYPKGIYSFVDVYKILSGRVS